MNRKKFNAKELNKKQIEHLNESQEKGSKKQRVYAKRVQKNLEQVYQRKNSLIQSAMLTNRQEIDKRRKTKSDKIEKNEDRDQQQNIRQSDQVKLISFNQGLIKKKQMKQMQQVKKKFEEIDLQFKNKKKQHFEKVRNQELKNKKNGNKQKKQQTQQLQIIYQQWFECKSAQWDEFLQAGLVREQNDQNMLEQQREKSYSERLAELDKKILKWQVKETQELNKELSLKASKVQELNKELQKAQKKEIILQFYNTKEYTNKQTYKQIMQKASKIFLTMCEQKNFDVNKKNRDEYVKILKYNLYKVGKKYLSQDNKQSLQPWILFKDYYQDILNTEDINFLAFRLKNQNLDFQMRFMFFEAAFQNFKQRCTIKKNPQNAIEINFKELTQISIKQSHIYYKEQDIKRLKKLVQTVKNSWYIQSHLAYYIREREKKLNTPNKEEQTFSETLKKISIFMKKAQVVFIDYSMTTVNGITLTSSQVYKQYPIFINLFSLFQDREKEFGFFESYTFFVLVHELAHSIIRKCDFFKPGESSNPFNYDEDNKMDGGWLFENLIFGQATKVYSSKDYQQIQGLLKCQQCPTNYRRKIPKNAKQYSELVTQIQRQYQKSQTLKQKKKLQQTYSKAYNLNNRKLKSQEQNLQEQLKNLENYIKKNVNMKNQINQINYINQVNQQKNQQAILTQNTLKPKVIQQMIQKISSFGKRNPKKSQLKIQGYRTLKQGTENQLKSQFRSLDIHCGTNYKSKE